MKVKIMDYCPDCQHPADQHKMSIIDDTHYSIECEICGEECIKTYETIKPFEI